MIVITGASDGLGLQLAKVFKDAGKKVVNISRGDSEFADVNISTDLLDPKAITKAAQQVVAIDEPLEVLINCAGVISFEKLESLSSEQIDKVFGVNVKAPLLLTSALMDRLKNDKSDIINVASTIGVRPHYDQSVYGSSKWALRGFSQNLQLELKGNNRVMSFCIGGFKSKIAHKVSTDHVLDNTSWMEPADIAGFVKTIVDLPRTMDVAEIIINRGPGK